VTPTPIALGISLCDYVIVEGRTGKVSLIGCFGALAASAFPTPPHTFLVYTDLTDGAGRGVANLTISRLDMDEVIRRQVKVINFKSRFTVVQYAMTVASLSFPVPGEYVVTLEIDHELVAQRALQVTHKGETS
jgi:hypothetical protein